MKDLIEIQIYKLINKSVNNAYAPLVDFIINDKRYLDRSDVIQDICVYFLEKDYVNKFDPTKGKLSTYTYRFVFWYLNTLRRGGYNKEILFTDLDRVNDSGELTEYEIPDFNDGEIQLLEKTKEMNVKNLKNYVLRGK